MQNWISNDVHRNVMTHKKYPFEIFISSWHKVTSFYSSYTNILCRSIRKAIITKYNPFETKLFQSGQKQGTNSYNKSGNFL